MFHVSKKTPKNEDITDTEDDHLTKKRLYFFSSLVQ